MFRETDGDALVKNDNNKKSRHSGTGACLPPVAATDTVH